MQFFSSGASSSDVDVIVEQSQRLRNLTRRGNTCGASPLNNPQCRGTRGGLVIGSSL